MKAKYLILLILFCAVAAACKQEPVPEAEVNGIALEFDPAVSQVPSTRQTIFGDASGRMPNRSSYGLFICDHYTGTSNPYSEYALRYNNIHAFRNGSGVWSYTYYGYTNSFPILYMIPKDENRDDVTDVNADIFAYAPWQESVTTPESVPFSIASAVDAMYAAENSHPTTNKDIDPATDSRITAAGSDGFRHLDVPLTFKHALSLLVFDLSLKNPDYNHPLSDDFTTNKYSLEYIQVDRKEGGHPLYASGTMNAMNEGALSDLVAENSIRVSDSNLASHYTDHTIKLQVSPNSHTLAYILQVPSQAGETYADGDYTFTFKFSGQVFPAKFTLLRSQLRHSDGSTYGFQPGYKYTFKFVIDNYIHFEGVTIGEWDTVEGPFQTEI